MDPTVDPFQPLLRLVDRYRQDVNHLRPPAAAGQVEETEKHLGICLPSSLSAFYARWNGAVLYRGALRIRTTLELAAVDSAHPGAIVFADGPRETDQWVFVCDTQGNHVFGKWTPEGLEPLHARFHRWLVGRIQLMEEEPRTDEDALDMLLSCDPRSPWLLLRKAEHHLSRGDPDRALPLLRQATVEDPGLLSAWHRLGDVLVASEPGEARFAYVKALRAVRLPYPIPGTWRPDPDLLTSLSHMFPDDDPAWERELADLLGERVSDAHTAEEATFYEAAAQALLRVLVANRDRDEARKQADTLLSRGSAFRVTPLLPDLRILLARLETDLGHHDDAEKRLRPILAHADPALRTRARLALARVVVVRQEPWAEEILEDVLHGSPSADDQAHALALLAERHLQHGRLSEADLSLEQLEVVLPQVTDPDFAANLPLLRGDLHRQGNDLDLARRAWAEAERLARANRDTKTRLRLAVRAGDLAHQGGDKEAAIAAWQEAASGFERLNLPLREAWTRVRLGRAGDPASLERARELFTSADLAAGVAAVDAAVQDPSISLQWHLARAAEHARLRAEAQKPRPPYVRADADRPERRLGAHQRAIAACGVRVVQVLRDLVTSEAKGLEGGSPRSGDPRLAAYTAAVDLLAHHPSFDAADVLLRQVVYNYVSGPAGTALKGALTRSPNMEIVSGLLTLLDKSDDSVALARAAEILGWRREPLATEALCRLAQKWPNLHVRRAAIAALGRIGDKSAIEAIQTSLDEPELAEIAAIALLLLGERQGMDFHAQLLASGQTTKGGTAGEIVGRYGDPSYLLLLLNAASTEEEAALGSLQGLGYLGDARAVPRLIEKTSQVNHRTAEVAAGALEILTGHHEPTEDTHLQARWTRWWEGSEGRFSPGLRYRYGRLLDPGVLIERLADDDLHVRASAYDELVITTGKDLPFDADGAWRIQVHHRERWAAWWQAHKQPFPAGRWIFHGRVTG